MTIRSCYLAFTYRSGEVYKLTSPVECEAQHSFSAIVALSSFLLKTLPQLIPPHPEVHSQDIKSNTTASHNPLGQFWKEYLIECITSQMSMRLQNSFYICVPCESIGGSQIIKQSSLFQLQQMKKWSNLTGRQQISNLYSIPLHRSHKKVGIYYTHAVSESQLFQPRANMPALFMGTLFNNEKWEVFDIPKGNIPSVQELQSFDSIIITGSSYSVHSQTAQISLAFQRLMQVYQRSQKLKLVGVCYGHQLISHHFGGEVITKQRKCGIERVCFNKSIIEKHSFLQPLEEHPSLYITQYHQEYVQTIPNGFQLLAASESCKVQALISHDKRILTSQFHSEFLLAYAQKIDTNRRTSNLNGLGIDFDEPRETVQANALHSSLFLQSIQAHIGS